MTLRAPRALRTKNVRVIASTQPSPTRLPRRFFGLGVVWAVRGVVLALLAAALYYGWREFWFLTDDAHITFRYIDHHQRGWGYVWNPPPFRPVEGYSNFLWMVLLEGIWVATGVDPPGSANVVSLVLSYGSLALGFAATWRLAWSERDQRWRFGYAASVVALAVTNRTFLTWTSSGLETALFSFCVMAWVFAALEVNRSPDLRWTSALSAAAACSALTRPDGVLLFLTSMGIIAFNALRTRDPRTAGLGALPLLMVPAHLAWRRSVYDEWLPNTYFAKHVSIWPDAGARYAASFVLEHAIWAWALIALIALGTLLWRAERDGVAPHSVAPSVIPALVALTLLAHAAYFIVIVGGDHFEYRIFAHAILPLGLALVALLRYLRLRPWAIFASTFAVIALGQPIAWVHYARTRELKTRPQTYKMYVPVADVFPKGLLRKYAASFDELQAWMMPRHVGTRHQEHKIFFEFMVTQYPDRAAGGNVLWKEQRGVYVIQTVGVPGWTMPEIAILDQHGLNDWVIARNEMSYQPMGMRLMAHERIPPPGYIECFDPNVSIQNRAVTVRPRPLPDARIIDCETRFRALMPR